MTAKHEGDWMNRKWIALMVTGSLLTGAGGTYAGMTMVWAYKWKLSPRAERLPKRKKLIRNKRILRILKK